jgi:peroxiredoxin
MADRIKINDTAMDFTLKDQLGEELNLRAKRGQKALLSFHPLAWTEVCAKQMQSLEKSEADFAGLNTLPLGLSIDTVPSKLAWAKSLGISKTRLLSDFWPHGAVATAFGIFREKNGFSERANIILDEKGKVIFVKVYEIKTLPDLEEILAFLKKNG